MATKRLVVPSLALGLLIPAALLCAPKPSAKPPSWQAVADVLTNAARDGKLVGAQLAIGDHDGVKREQSFGVLAPGSAQAVDADTLFCIGSCSKPIAAACILILSEEGVLDLDTPVSKWLPALEHLRLPDGSAAKRAPTLRELLAHRGGVYSQKQKLTRPQVRAIRDYSLTLEQSVALIAEQKLLSPPGSEYAYSGAGYVVAGRVAEVAAKAPFEELLQKTLGRPLRWKRTTYFPRQGDKDIAIGGNKSSDDSDADNQSPHRLGAAHRLPLIGGGLYSTARETAAFGQMMLNEGKVRKKVGLSPRVWREMTRRQYPGQNYGLGWGLTFDPKDTVLALGHGGSLARYRSSIHVDLQHGYFLVAHWTVKDGPGNSSDSVGAELNKAWHAELKRLPER